MMLRRRLLPKTLPDFGAVCFVALIVPVMYWFEVFVVHPEFFKGRNFLYLCHAILSTYFMLNIVGNYVLLYLTDTSIRGRILSTTMEPSWKFCPVCESITPPRSWHCDICQICILKRDHHCNFTACCIGHDNQRYFTMFLFHMSLASIYCTFFNAFYLWKITSFTLLELFKLVFPLAMIAFGTDFSLVQLYRVLCVISIIGMVIVVALTAYNLMNLSKGVVMYENAKNVRDYDLGNFLDNLKQVLGERWYLTCLSPFVSSTTDCDGINWGPIIQRAKKSK